MADLDPVVDEPDARPAHTMTPMTSMPGRLKATWVPAWRHQVARRRPRPPGPAPHGRRPGLGQVHEGPVLADLLADAPARQPADEQRRARARPPQGDAARGMRLIIAASSALGPRRRRVAPPRRATTRVVEGHARATRSRCRARGPCRPPRRRRPGAASSSASSMASARSGSTIDLRARRPRPRATSAMMASGSSSRGLSEVSTATSAAARPPRRPWRAACRGRGPRRTRTRTGPGARRPARGRCRGPPASPSGVWA